MHHGWVIFEVLYSNGHSKGIPNQVCDMQNGNKRNYIELWGLEILLQEYVNVSFSLNH